MANKTIEKAVEDRGLAASLVFVLERKNIITWHSFFPSKTPLGYDIELPPVVMWKYKEGIGSDPQNVSKKIRNLSSKVGWCLEELEGDKWRLMPQLVWSVFNRNKDYLPVDAADEVKHQNPEYGVETNNELLVMAYYLHENLIVEEE